MSKRILGQSFPQAGLTADPPTGDVGIDMTQFTGQSKTRWFLVTVTVDTAASDLYVWGALAQGVPEDETDDIWGLHQDPYRAPLGKIATALPEGAYHFLIDGLGLYSRVYFQGSAGDVNVILSEVNEAARGN